MYQNLLSKQPWFRAVCCYFYFILALDSSNSQPTYRSQHLPAPHSSRKHNLCLAGSIFKQTSVSRAQRQPDRKAAGTERSCSLLSTSSAGGKEKKREKRQVERAKRLRARETAHEQSRHLAIQRARCLRPPPWLARLQPQAQLPQGQTSV